MCGDHSKSVFIPLYVVLVRPHLEYGMPACSPNLVADINQSIQRLATRLITGIRHIPYEERLQRVDLITAFSMFTGFLDVDPKLVFYLPLVMVLEAIPHTRCSKVWATFGGEGPFFRRGLWNIGKRSRLPSVQPLLSKCLWRGWRKFGKKSCHIFLIDWNLISPIL